MKRSFWPTTLILIHALVFFLFLGTVQAATPRTLVAAVERVSDGDTLVVISDNGTRLRIRLPGIDAPEIPTGRRPPNPTPRRLGTTLNI